MMQFSSSAHCLCRVDKFECKLLAMQLDVCEAGHLVRKARHKPRATPPTANPMLPRGVDDGSPAGAVVAVAESEELDTSQAHCTRLAGNATSRIDLYK